MVTSTSSLYKFVQIARHVTNSSRCGLTSSKLPLVSLNCSAAAVAVAPTNGQTHYWFSTKKKRYIAATDEPSDHHVSTTPPPVQEFVKQPFVQVDVPPGEWDPKFQNPLYRPKFKKQARIISNEDFERRPLVAIESEDFKSIEDAQIVLSWMTCELQEKLYSMYVKLMNHMYSKYEGRTSHEYVCRVLAHRFNVTPERCAAIIQLQYNQNQIEISGERVQHELGYVMDQGIIEEIKEAYETYKMTPPSFDEYVEEVAGKEPDAKTYVVVEDAFDLEQMIQDLQLHDDNRARMLISNHNYIEDVDESTKVVPIDKDCTNLIRAKDEFINEYEQEVKKYKYKKGSDPAEHLQWRTTNAKGIKRPRWKYVLQATNTRNVKKKLFKERDIYHKKYGDRKKYIPIKYNGGSKQINTIVCESSDGKLRQARWDELKYCSWKPNVRHVQEFSYRQAKLGWLNYTLRGDTKAWGLGPNLVGEKFQQLKKKGNISDEDVAEFEQAAENVSKRKKLVVDADAVPANDENAKESSGKDDA